MVHERNVYNPCGNLAQIVMTLSLDIHWTKLTRLDDLAFFIKLEIRRVEIVNAVYCKIILQ